ncbi:Protein WHAT'S THIS FACTOR 9, mitochondrial [Linum perenne]
MIRKTSKLTCIKTLISAPPNPIFSLVWNHPEKLPFWYSQTQRYVQNFIARNPNSCIPISDVSKKGLQFDLKIKVASYLRQYPSIFEEFVGPQHNLPWFRLTYKAAEIDREEMSLLEVHQEDLKERLKKFILMSKEKALPLKIIKGLGLYLGWSDDMLQKLDDGSFRLVELEGGFKGLAVESHGRVLSVLQKNCMKRGVYSGEPMEALEFPLFPSKGLRLKKKIADWLIEFQKLPYVSPYEDYSYLDTDSDIAEKRVVGNKTRTAILKESYRHESAFKRHPLVSVRQKYVDLMMESDSILKRRRTSNQVETVDHGTSES